MKIGIVSSVFGYFHGGAERVAEELARQCIHHGHDVFVIACNPKRGFSSRQVHVSEDGLRVFMLPVRNLYPSLEYRERGVIQKSIWHLLDIWNFWLWSPIRQILTDLRPDILNCHTLPGISPVIWSVAHRLKIPVIQTLHDYSFLCVRATFSRAPGINCGQVHRSCYPCFGLRQVNRRLSRNVSGVIAPTRDILVRFKKKEFFEGALHKVIANPCPSEIASRWSQPREMHKKPTFLFLGQLEPHKGIPVLLEAFQLIPPDTADLYIAGSGGLEKAVTAACQKFPHIHYLGTVAGPSKREVLEKADVIVLPSVWREASSIVILEAFQMGIPVIASRIGGIPELVSDRQTGLLVEPESIQQLFLAMEELVQNRHLWGTMHRNIIEMDKSFMAGETYYSSFMQLCEEVLSCP